MLPVEEIETRLQSFLKKVHLSESSISTVLGLLVVVTIGILIINYFQQEPSSQITDEAAMAVNEDLLEQEEASKRPRVHIVARGDDLSKIAKEYYGDRQLWIEIAEVNGITAPDLLEVGQELVLPEVVGAEISASVPEVDTEVLVGLGSSSGSHLDIRTTTSYVVQPGDTLAKVAGKVYGDEGKWSVIFEANGMWSPDYLEAGQELVIPRD
jgi:nucleoid-associated protein YgaU